MNVKDVILQLPLRADKLEDDNLVQTFVKISALMPLLKSENNQVLYGRRGTGKTHVFKYLKTTIEAERNDCCIFVDLRQLGSSGSIYSDNSIPKEQRAIRLFTDLLQEIRNQIIGYITKDDDNKVKYLSNVTPVLDGLTDLLNKKEVAGKVKVEQQAQSKFDDSEKTNITISKNPSFSLTSTEGKSILSYNGSSAEGYLENYIDFRSVSQTLNQVLELLVPHKIWILVDEFAEISTELQVLLADMFRRVLSPLKNCIYKIAAIEHRTTFKIQTDKQNYIGLELGADVFTLNLDDVMVFSNNQAQALTFFRDLIFRHVNSMMGDEKYATSNDMVHDLFTQENAFEELVQAAEGVPRDAFNILTKAITNDYYNKVSVKSIRKAAKSWYVEDKQRSIHSFDQAGNLLRWIIDVVINERQSRAFLLRNDKEDDLINYLYDSRILHIIKQDISGRDSSGMKYDVYSIDYGCYVDLMNTKQAPKGLFIAEIEEGKEEYCNVPQDDYRSIRRAILNMDLFYASMPTDETKEKE